MGAAFNLPGVADAAAGFDATGAGPDAGRAAGAIATGLGIAPGTTVATGLDATGAGTPGLAGPAAGALELMGFAPGTKGRGGKLILTVSFRGADSVETEGNLLSGGVGAPDPGAGGGGGGMGMLSGIK